MKGKGGRAAVASLVAAMALGFLYSGIASVRFYVQLIGGAAANGAAASIDHQVAVLGLSASEIRAAVQRAEWPADADVSLVVSEGEQGRALNATQLHYALSYLLYPKRISLTSTLPETGFRIVIGPPDGLSGHIHRVSYTVMLVDAE